VEIKVFSLRIHDSFHRHPLPSENTAAPATRPIFAGSRLGLPFPATFSLQLGGPFSHGSAMTEIPLSATAAPTRDRTLYFGKLLTICRGSASDAAVALAMVILSMAGAMTERPPN